MMDRSANMRAIRSKDMRPELAVRHLVHKMGYRYRLHKANLPGKPGARLSSYTGASGTHTKIARLQYSKVESGILGTEA